MSKNSLNPVFLSLLLLVLPAVGRAQLGINVSVNLAPPALPVYEQPPIPGEGYVWTPGFWAWSDDSQGYYWVPGTWVLAPQPGFLWTPGYWGGNGGAFLWHEGYWGPVVGFYGGVNYGYGYGGRGYEGGYWQDGHMYYNRSVTNISDTHITNVYNKTVVNNVTVNRVSYNGGNGGVQAQPTPAELAAEHERHVPAIPAQREQVQTARSNPSLRVSANHGAPPIAATSRPGAFSGAGVVAARQTGNLSTVHQGAPVGREPQSAPPAPRTGAPANTAPAHPAPAPRAPAEEERRAAPPPHPAPAPRAPAEEERRAAPPPHAAAPAPAPHAAPAPRPAPEERHEAPRPQPRPEHDHDRS